MKNVDAKVTTEKKVVDAKEVDEGKKLVFVEVKPASIRQYWKQLSLNQKLGLVLGVAGAAVGAAAGGYFAGRSITKALASKETAETETVDVIETEISNDEVE